MEQIAAVIQFGVVYQGTLNRDMIDRFTIKFKPRIGPVKVTTLVSQIKLHNLKPSETHGALCNRLPLAAIDHLRAAGYQIVVKMNEGVATINPTCLRELYPSQQLIVSWLMANVYTPERVLAGTASTCMNIRAGTGKTRIAGALAAAIGERALYVVPQVELARQTVADLRVMFGDNAVGLYPSPWDITVVVINTAVKMSNDEIAQYGLIIYDEVHKYVSASRAEFLYRSYVKHRFAMSATTDDRRDGLDSVNTWHFTVDGRVVDALTVPGFSYDDTEFIMSADIVKYSGPPDFTKRIEGENGMLSASKMWGQLMTDPYRMSLLMTEFMTLWDAGHSIYVFAEEREHVILLHKHIHAAVGDAVCAPELFVFMGGCKNSAEVVENARVIVTTYGYAGTGVSIARMTAILHATSRRAQIVQIIGRIRRRDGDMTAPRKVVYINDVKSGLGGQVVDQIAAYKFYDFPYETRSVSWKDITLSTPIASSADAE